MLVHLMLELYACDKEFSQEDAIAFAREIFLTDDIESHFVQRATRSLRPQTATQGSFEAALAARHSAPHPCRENRPGGDCHPRAFLAGLPSIGGCSCTRLLARVCPHVQGNPAGCRLPGSAWSNLPCSTC